MMQPDRKTRVLVTGGAGFLGTHLVAALKTAGYERVLAPPRRECDLRDFRSVKKLFAGFEPEIVIHCAAAVGGIAANQKEPGRFFYDNAAMALHLIETSRIQGVERFIGIGTTCSYPRNALLPLAEASLWGGAPDQANAPYGHAKRFMAAQLEAYQRQYGFRGLVIIPANLYGPGDHFDLETSHVIPGMLRRFEEAAEQGAASVTVWGDGTPTRDFMHVADAARGIVLALRKPELSGVLNLGSGQETRMLDLAQTIGIVTGFGGEILWDATRANGQPRRFLDCTIAREQLGFEARIPLAEGLAQTLEWYQRCAKRRWAA